MVLEIILDPRKAEKFSHILLLSFVYTLVSVFLAIQIFPQQASILSIALITILFIPFFQGRFEQEEAKEDIYAERKSGGNIFMRHKSIISIFTAFFLGIVIATSFVFIFLPFHDAFSLQSSVLRGLASSPETDFLRIFLNNTQVMVLMFLFSVIMGAGAIFILAWNASVIAVYAGSAVNSLTSSVPLPAAYLVGLPSALGSIALHGVPEILAYFIAGLAGGILSFGIVKEKINSKEFKQIFLDSVAYLATAEALLAAAGLIEALL
ncbi:MAG: stage II sporulation protein M [Candidatus Aenigmarchaeota archaeon]|nr:stage II sporulation protein M [Candidatus Aenigmarchaeota archaeon]